MKKSILILMICLTSLFGIGQIEIDYKSGKEVQLNGTTINNTTSFDDVVKMCGEEPTLYKEYSSGKVVYHFENLGLVIHTLNNQLIALGVNFNWDGDENFPEKTFEGSLMIGKKVIKVDAKEGVVNELSEFDINCVIPGMCMNNPKTNKNPILLGFKDELITQVLIEFH
ncbi:MAG: hypothetical protein ACPGWM_01880 [Flavobacteriales bacterium]